jgi:hypothetical protein
VGRSWNDDGNGIITKTKPRFSGAFGLRISLLVSTVFSLFRNRLIGDVRNGKYHF